MSRRTVAPGMTDYQIMSQIGSLKARIAQDAGQGLGPDKRRAEALAKYEAELARRREADPAAGCSHTRPGPSQPETTPAAAPDPPRPQPAAAIAAGSRIHTQADDYLKSALSELLQEYSLGCILETTWSVDGEMFRAAQAAKKGAAA